MLIIARLPFAVPDPVSEWERTLYANMNEYKAKVVVPEMLVKLKQGAGRLIRAETDTGVVAILDARASLGLPRNEVSWEEDEQRSGANARLRVGAAECSLRGRNGSYRRRVLAALPQCGVTNNIDKVARFLREKKPSEYFEEAA
jgi:ATP-dependent DNA helicase DinG